MTNNRLMLVYNEHEEVGLVYTRADKNLEKTRLNATIGNRDCDPFTPKKRHRFACFACSCVQFSLLERENGENSGF